MDNRNDVVATFDAAASSYDAAAATQRSIAARLLDFIDAAEPRTILDIGCGTGALTALLADRYPQSALTGIDAAPAMLAVAQRKLPKAQFVRQDAAAITLPGRFDLIVSSMALHWLKRPSETMQRWQELLTPQGLLAVALPVAGSFAEWRNLCATHGLTDRLWPFPDVADFAGRGQEYVEVFPLCYARVQDFLSGMKRTGACTARRGTAPIKPGRMRKLLRAAPRPFTASYRVLYLLCARTEMA